MTPARAQEICDAIWRVHGWRPKPEDGGPTPDEHHEILAVWEAMPGWTTYYDAVDRIARPEIYEETP